MRKFLLSFLMLVMLTPGLACGPFMGMSKAQAESKASMPDCKDMGMDMGMDSAKETPSGDHFFFKDCSKSDLYNTDYASLKKPDLSKVLFLAWADTAPDYISVSTDFRLIHGPPSDWPDIYQTKPSILLTTQRIRE